MDEVVKRKNIKIQIDQYLPPCTKLKSKWIKDLNIKVDILNLIEEKLGNSPEHISTGDNILNGTLTVQALKSTINKWDLTKMKYFYIQRALPIGQSGNLQNRKIFLPTPHPVDD